MSMPQSSSEYSIEVLVIAADSMTASLLTSELRQHAKFRITECAPDAESISDRLDNHSPSTLLLLGDESRETIWDQLSLLAYLRNQYPSARPVVLLEDSSPEFIAEVFRAGAKGVFCRSDYDAELLCRCIRCVSSGQIWANSEQLGVVLDAFAEHPPLRLVNVEGAQLLTRREEDVVRLVEEGMTNRQIAEELQLSEHTIRNNLFRIFDKLGVSTRVELALYTSHSAKRGPSRALPARRSKPELLHSRTSGALGNNIRQIR